MARWFRIYQSLGATRGERASMAAIAAFVALIPVAFVFAHRGVAPIALFVGLIVSFSAPVWRAGVPYFLTRPDFQNPLVRAGLFFLAFCVWISISALWSSAPAAWRMSMSVGGPALAGGAIAWEIGRRPTRETQALAGVAEAAVLIAAALLLVEALTGGFLRSIVPPEDHSGGRGIDMIALGRGASALATLFFGALYLLSAKGRPLWVRLAFFAAASVAAIRFGVFANVFALAAGACVGLAALRAPRATTIALAGAALLCLAAAPLAAHLPVTELLAAAGGAPASWLQRLAIWKTGAAAAIECLPWGCGVEYARTLSETGATISIPGVDYELPLMPIHPHDLFIEIWLELGLPGVALFALTIVSAAQALLNSRLDRGAIAAIVATAASFFASSLVEVSIWQVWRLAGLALAALFIALAMKSGDAASASA